VQDISSERKKNKKALKEEKKAKKAAVNAESEDAMERKRKRISEAEDGDAAHANGVGEHEPSRERKPKKSKKLKVDHQSKPENPVEDNEPKPSSEPLPDTQSPRKDGPKYDKAQKKKEKQQRREERKQAKPAQKAAPAPRKGEVDKNAEEWEDVSVDGDEENDIEAVDVSGLADEPQAERHSSASASPAPDSLFSNNSVQPSASSNTSIDVPASNPDKARKLKLPKIDPEVLKERLRQRIEALRTARKADGPDGRPARNRQELLEARRKKEEQRKQHKKDLRKQAKEDEQRLKTEQELAQLRGSGSPMSLDLFSSPRPASPDTNFSFGRVAFDNGQQLDSTLSNIFDGRRKKGPSDPRTALQAAEAKRKRIAGLDEVKRADIAEKDLWLNAKKRAHGEHVRDDTDLLKKTLKRKEKMKSKSEKEWDERIKGVEKAKEAKQRKREENLLKRREEKGVKGKKAKARLAQERSAKKKTVRRPGFEGSFRSKARK
jgi:Surfeit locus protein 6